MYHIDEFVTANCSSDYSSPPATLTWYINGEQALYGELQPRIEHTIPAHDYNLRRQILQTHFYLNGPRFYNPTRILELKCVAEIENFPTLRRESVLKANLIQDDNLNNQMLLSSGYQNKSSRDLCSQTLLLIFSIIFTTLLHRISS
ncbi:uncharacterized protein LOC129953581 [Eupeodes corollae]|uniref:uncharacterized protein LOC129953581 n=1 Tax=Eupeodes corollae TaxID=290404 RepID=UPI002491B6C9|nr:uncharacterized protein LOC129953581 [Eupeodes corollae]